MNNSSTPHFNLAIFSPSHVQYRGEVVSLDVRGIGGVAGILAGHEPMVMALQDNQPIHFVDRDHQSHQLTLCHAMVHVTTEGVVVHAETVTDV